MRQLISWELRQRKQYLFWWVVCTCGVVAMLLLLYPSIHSQAEQLNKVINQLPESLRNFKNGNSQVDIATPIGYLNSQLYYITLPLLQIIMSIGLGASLLARDEQNHTLELLLARPLSRSKVLAAKALSGIILVGFVGLLAALTAIGLAKLVHMDIAATNILITSLLTTLFSLSFGAIAFTLSAAGSATRRTSLAIAVAVGFGGYLLASLSSLSHYIELPAKLLPYHYFTPVDMLAGHVPKGISIYLVGIFLLTTCLSWFSFRRRDIN